MKKQLYTIVALMAIGITANAQVGIGTTTPDGSSMLDITSTTKGLLMPRMTTANRTAIASPAAGLQVFDTTTNTIWFFDGTAWKDSKVSTNIYNSNGTLTANRTVTMGGQTLNFTGGNVAVGPSAPAVDFQVSNATGTAPRILISNTAVPGVGSAMGTLLFSGSDGGATVPASTGQLPMIRAYGEETWNTTSHGSSLGFFTVPAGALGNVQRLHIHSDGNVGIGTASPAAKLDVAGTVKITDGSQGAGKILTSDANGLASWQTPSAAANGSETKVNAGTNTTVTGSGTTADPYVVNASNIYTADGTLTGSRTVAMGANNLYFTGTGNIGVGTTAPAYPVHIQRNAGAIPAITLDNQATITNGTLLGRVYFGGNNTAGGTAISASIIGYAAQNWTSAAQGTYLRLHTTRNGTTNNTAITMENDGSFFPNPYSAGANPNQTLGTSTNRWSTAYFNTAPAVTSDGRLKTNIKNVNYGLADVMKMRPVTYNWKADPTNNHMVGFIAQEMEKIVPEAVEAPKNNSDHYSVRYEELIPVLTKAIQEQQAEIDALKKRNEATDLAFAKLAAEVKEMKETLHKK